MGDRGCTTATRTPYTLHWVGRWRTQAPAKLPIRATAPDISSSFLFKFDEGRGMKNDAELRQMICLLPKNGTQLWRRASSVFLWSLVPCCQSDCNVFAQQQQAVRTRQRNKLTFCFPILPAVPPGLRKFCLLHLIPSLGVTVRQQVMAYGFVGMHLGVTRSCKLNTSTQPLVGEKDFGFSRVYAKTRSK